MVSLDKLGPSNGFNWAKMAINQLKKKNRMESLSVHVICNFSERHIKMMKDICCSVTKMEQHIINIKT